MIRTPGLRNCEKVGGVETKRENIFETVECGLLY